MKLSKFVSVALLSLLLAGLIANILPLNLNVKEAQASPDILPSDGDAWTESTTNWTQKSGETDDISAVDGAWVGSYRIQCNQTDGNNVLGVALDMGHAYDLSGYDYLRFHIRIDRTNTSSYILRNDLTATLWSVNYLRFRHPPSEEFNSTFVIPLKALVPYSGGVLTDRRYIQWELYYVDDGDIMWIDGVYFGHWEDQNTIPDATNSWQYETLPNIYANYPLRFDKPIYDGVDTWYNSLWTYFNLTTGVYSVVGEGLETEVIGHNLYQMSRALMYEYDPLVYARCVESMEYMEWATNNTGDYGGVPNRWINSMLGRLQR